MTYEPKPAKYGMNMRRNDVYDSIFVVDLIDINLIFDYLHYLMGYYVVV